MGLKNRLPFISAVLTAGAIVATVASLSVAGGSDSGGSSSGNLVPPTATPDSDSIVPLDPFLFEELLNAGINPSGWRTDFSKHSVDFSEIIQAAAPKDLGIPAIDNPKFMKPKEADEWIGNLEPVISMEIDGDARAYPLQVLIWHEIVNDVVGGVPVTVTFCPLCNSAIVFDRTLGGVTYDFGISGNLRNSDLIMYDRQTESWWQQFTGEAIVGTLTGEKLKFLPASIISWEDFKAANPKGKVLSRDTGFNRAYGHNPYAGYDRVDNPPGLFKGDTDGRLLPKERVAAVTIGDVDVAFPFQILEKEGVVNYSVNGHDLVVFFEPGTASSLDSSSIRSSRDVGATGVFAPNLKGQKLTFRLEGDNIVDGQTGSVWDILGKAVEGPLSGEKLTPILHGDHFWFAWAAFKPNTIIYRGNGQ